MTRQQPQAEHRTFAISLLAIGYFLSYTAYVVVTKLADLSLPVNDNDAGNPIQLVVGLLSGVLITLPLLIVFVHKQVPAHKRWPGIRPEHLVAGLASAVIVVTTTIAFRSQPSVLLALLLMRGGVLILSRMLDLIFERRVGKYSLLALALSLGAVGIALGSVGTQSLPARRF